MGRHFQPALLLVSRSNSLCWSRHLKWGLYVCGSLLSSKVHPGGKLWWPMGLSKLWGSHKPLVIGDPHLQDLLELLVKPQRWDYGRRAQCQWRPWVLLVCAGWGNGCMQIPAKGGVWTRLLWGGTTGRWAQIAPMQGTNWSQSDGRKCGRM